MCRDFLDRVKTLGQATVADIQVAEELHLSERLLEGFLYYKLHNAVTSGQGPSLPSLLDGRVRFKF
jgi:hypothetical protein